MSHGSWTRANEILVQEQDQKEKERWKDYVGPVSKELIRKRRKAIEEGEEELAKELKKEIRKQVKKDRKEWEDELVNDDLSCREQWQ